MKLCRCQLLAGPPLANKEHWPVDRGCPREPLRERQERLRATDRLFNTHSDISQTLNVAKNAIHKHIQPKNGFLVTPITLAQEGPPPAVERPCRQAEPRAVSAGGME